MTLQIYRADGTPKVTPPGVVPLVNTLPATPYDGQQIDYQTPTMATLGVRWRFVYRAGSASSSKWEFVGGPNWVSYSVAQAAVATGWGTGYDPKITIPLAGDYLVSLFCYPQLPAGGGQVAMALDNLGADLGVTQTVLTGVTVAGPQHLALPWTPPYTLPAGRVLAFAFYAAASGTTIGERYLTIQPVRVG